MVFVLLVQARMSTRQNHNKHAELFQFHKPSEINVANVGIVLGRSGPLKVRSSAVFPVTIKHNKTLQGTKD